MEGDAVSEQDRGSRRPRFGVTPGLVISILLAVVLVALVLANTDETPVDLLVTTVTGPLWLLLAVVIVASFAMGYLARGLRYRRLRR
jgi:uncharacterized integral membrane protein